MNLVCCGFAINYGTSNISHFKIILSWYKLMFYKNKLYKNTHAEIWSKIKNKLRIITMQAEILIKQI